MVRLLRVFLTDTLVKKVLVLTVCSAMILGLAACGTKELTCDRCGAKITASKTSNATDDWTIYCNDCAEELGLNELPE